MEHKYTDAINCILAVRRTVAPFAELSAALDTLDSVVTLIDENKAGFPDAIRRKDELAVQIKEHTLQEGALKKTCDELEETRKRLTAECAALRAEFKKLQSDLKAERASIVERFA